MWHAVSLIPISLKKQSVHFTFSGRYHEQDSTLKTLFIMHGCFRSMIFHRCVSVTTKPENVHARVHNFTEVLPWSWFGNFCSYIEISSTDVSSLFCIFNSAITKQVLSKRSYTSAHYSLYASIVFPTYSALTYDIYSTEFHSFTFLLKSNVGVLAWGCGEGQLIQPLNAQLTGLTS